MKPVPSWVATLGASCSGCDWALKETETLPLPITDKQNSSQAAHPLVSGCASDGTPLSQKVFTTCRGSPAAWQDVCPGGQQKEGWGYAEAGHKHTGTHRNTKKIKSTLPPTHIYTQTFYLLLFFFFFPVERFNLLLSLFPPSTTPPWRNSSVHKRGDIKQTNWLQTPSLNWV